ncbi:MAG: helix-turn-helix domain-containing protein [Ruminococcus sp.]|nr:helix-turn-helix domain-containing protein [Ruminococcus sp.]
MHYSAKLQYLREKFDLTQTEAGKIINLDSGTYSNYEHEVILIPLKHLNTLCNYYNVSLDYIFSFTEEVNYKNSDKNIDKKKSGTRLKEFRKDNKLTQIKLAKILNIGNGTIAGYETGNYLIATPFLYTICSKYHISADYLLGKTDNPKYFN